MALRERCSLDSFNGEKHSMNNPDSGQFKRVRRAGILIGCHLI